MRRTFIDILILLLNIRRRATLHIPSMTRLARRQYFILNTPLRSVYYYGIHTEATALDFAFTMLILNFLY